MLSCLICSNKTYRRDTNITRISRTQVARRKRIFPTFCKFLGVSEDDANIFSNDFDFEKEDPYCSNCIHFPVDLCTHADIKAQLEEEILSLQVSICTKFRQLSDTNNEIETIVTKLRDSIKNVETSRSYDEPYIDEDEDNTCSRGVNVRSGVERLRNQILKAINKDKSIPVKPRRSKQAFQKQRNRKSQILIEPESLTESRLITVYPANFITPLPIPEVLPKVEIKEEPLDFDDAYSEGPLSSTSFSMNIENADQERDFEVHDAKWSGISTTRTIIGHNEFEDSDNSFGIAPAEDDLSNFSEEPPLSNQPEWRSLTRLEQSVLEAKPYKSKRRLNLKNKKHAKKSKDMDTDDSDYEEDGDGDSDYTNDEDEDEECFKKPTRRNAKSRKHRDRDEDPTPLERKKLKQIEFLGEMVRSEDGNLTFRDTEVLEWIENDVQKLKCGKCDQTYSFKTSSLYAYSFNVKMRRHIQESHLGGYKCNLCAKPAYKEFSSYLTHVEIHSKSAVDCNICGKPFKYQSKDYQAHMWSHKSEDEKQEAIRAGVKVPRNQRNKIRVRKHQCATCGKCFISQFKLLCHGETHRDKTERDQERVACEICGKLILRVQLQHHSYTHKKPTPVPRYPCEYCSQYFDRPAAVKLHIRRHHTGEKPFVCQLCPKAFYNDVCRRRHMATHSDIRAFSCPLCSTGFKVQSNMIKHMKKFHTNL